MRVKQLKLGIDKLTADADLNRDESFMYRSQHEVDKTLGPAYETAFKMPLLRSMQQTEMAFWHGFVSNMLHGRAPVRFFLFPLLFWITNSQY